MLTIGSIFVILGGINRILNPKPINYDGMIIFAIFGVVINFLAAYFTREGNSINQKAVNLHMLEDVLGWVVVLIGSILMKFTNISLVDSIMSIGIAIFILINAFKNLKDILDLFLEKYICRGNKKTFIRYKRNRRCSSYSYLEYGWIYKLFNNAYCY